MNKRMVIGGALGLCLALAAAWAFGLFGGNPALAELEQLRDEMSNDNLADAERGALREQFRDRIESLDESQRQAFFEANRGEWMQRAQERMDEFFTLAPDAQRQQLDAMIDRMRQWSQNAEARPGGGDRGGRGGRNFTDAQRDEWAKRRLDRTTPKMRAQRDEFRRMMTDRLEARGIDGGSIRGGWRGRA